MNNAIEYLHHRIIVSCQAPIDSPLYHPSVIAAMAQAAVNGAAGVRIDTPNHIIAVRQKVNVPIIGLWKQVIDGYDVYITPQFRHAQAIAKAGADIVAIDATQINRPGEETLKDIITKIHQQLGKPVMADVDTIESAIAPGSAGADIVSTTLFGYTTATKHLFPPGFTLLSQMLKELDIPVFCEGDISSPQMACQALELGAYAVVVGTAITGVDFLTKAYAQAVNKSNPYIKN
ncbi:MAG: N-acetylmannosamine-6-phosphate 2-epimerase [Richelia sp.]|nr:N-acetylmannosamine-6-phosphate 2-epimerase [Richelia sp.]CDN15513.1 N-acetylmannosamine-6-phosphate 2-epimerase [Richelia intracellularis]